MRIFSAALITLSLALSSASLAADLRFQGGAIASVPSLIGEVTIRNAAGQESYLFRQGDLIHFDFILRNLADQPVTVRFGGCAVGFLVVSEDTGAALWSSLSGIECPPESVEVTIAPRWVQTVSTRWNQELSHRRGETLPPVTPGVYRLIVRYPGWVVSPANEKGLSVSVMKTFRIESNP